MKHHTKDKGDIGVAFVIADLASRGLRICLPMSEHLPFDLIAVKETGVTLKVSVKYRHLRYGCLQIHFTSCASTSKKTYTTKIDKKMIDLIAVYCPDNGKVYYINPNQFKSCVYLRVLKSKNNQSKRCNNAEDFLVI